MKRYLPSFIAALVVSVFLSVSNAFSQGCSDTSYTVSTGGVFAPIDASGASIVGPFDVFLNDDEMSGLLPIGFTFRFYGVDYTDFNISSNGFITFEDDFNDGCCDGQFLPDPNSPNNLIAFAWEDLSPNNGGIIQYFYEGTAPNRKLVVDFIDVPHFSGGGLVTTQIILFETTNEIEIHTTSMTGNGDPHTMGIEDATGSNAKTVPGRNAADWLSLIHI